MRTQHNSVTFFHSAKCFRLAKWLTGCLVLMFSLSSQATHFRGGIITWAAANLDGDGQFNDIELTVKTAWRFDNVTNPTITATPTLTFTQTSNIINYINGNATLADYALRTTTFTAKNLTATQSYALVYSATARISTLVNNADGPWSIQATVLMSGNNLAPKIDFPFIFEVPKFQADGATPLNNWTFNINSTDPNSDKIRYRVATTSEMGGGVLPSGFSINANTGQITWTGSGSLAAGLYSAGIVVEDIDANGNVKSKSHADFILDLQAKGAVQFTSPGIPTSRNIIVEKGSSYSFSLASTVPINTASLGNVSGALIESPADTFTFVPGPIGAGLNPGTYPITFEVDATSNATTKNYLMLNYIVPDPNAPKIINVDGDLVVYSGTEPVLIDQNINAVVTDANDADLNGGNMRYNVTFTDGEYENLGIKSVGDGAGEIRVTNGSIFYEGNLFGTIDSFEDGIGRALKINFTTPFATLPAVQALVRSLTYVDSFVLRAPGDRALSLFLQDSNGANSAYNFGVTVGAHPSSPGTGGPALSNNVLTITKGQTVVLSNSNINYSDPDTNAAGITITASAVTNGRFALASAPSVAITSFTQSQINLGQIVFVHNNSNIAPSYNTAATDGTNPSAVTPGVVSFTGTNVVSVSLQENKAGVVTISGSSVTAPATFAIIGGADQALFSINASTGLLSFVTAPNFEAPTDAGTNNIYNVDVTVSGAAATTSLQAVTVTITNTDEAPTLTSNGGGTSANINVIEGSTAVTTALATDPDAGDTITYSISGTDAGDFTINPTTGVLVFAATPNTGAPTDSNLDNIYNVIVTASDGNNSDSQTLSVTVRPSGWTPVTTITSNGGGTTASINVNENNTAVTTVIADSATSYSITGGVDQSFFSINSATGVLRFITAPDFDVPADAGNNNTYVVIVSATGGATTDAQTITVNIQNTNGIPIITSNGGGASALVTHNETTTAVTTIVASDADLGDTLTYTITGGEDQAKFTVNSATGALSFISAPIFATPTDVGANNTYVVNVTASDGTTSDAQVISVQINASPVIASNGGGATANVSVNENATAVTTVTATDANAGATQTYSLNGGTDAAKFSINATSGALTLISAPDFEAPTDSDANNTYVVIVRVTDNSGAVDNQTITVTVQNINEFTPVITSNGGAATAGVSINENTTAVTTVIATDADVGAVITYSVSGVDAAAFIINSTTGVLSFVSAPNFETPTDSGADNNYVVIVTASDGTNSIAQTITVAVQNLNDNTPVITSNGGGATATISVNENTTAVSTIIAADADAGATLTYSISGVDAAAFTINSSTGALRFVSAPNFEIPTDNGADNIYAVIVSASDGTNSTLQMISVSVQNLNDNTPVISSYMGAPNVGVSLDENTTAVATITATDADAGATLTYSISGTDAAAFIINSTTGVLSFVSAPNFESPTDSDVNNSYVVTVTVSDGVTTDTQTLTVTVQNLNDNAPTITSNGGGATASVNIVELTKAVTTVTANPGENSGGIIFNIVGGKDAAFFTINPTTGALSFAIAPAYTTDIYEVQVEARGIGDNTDTQLLNIVVLKDTDRDGIPDGQDISKDEDGDGVPDILESNKDTDGDGIPDNRDDDSDNDGILDAIESGLSGKDTDGDGIDDTVDATQTGGPDVNGDGIDDNAKLTDTDADGIPDTLDPDSDGDGVPDAIEFLATGVKPDTGIDTDKDGKPDYRDNDSDNDGISDGAESNATGIDTDNDGIDDAFDVDKTGGIDANDDGVDDAIKRPDTDSDGVIDMWDLDTDNDGITDVIEAGLNDLDADALADAGVVVTKTPRDSDNDGTPDYRDLDSNNDGTWDITGSPAKTADLNNDGRIDVATDTDGDGIANIIDGEPSTRGSASDKDGDTVGAGLDRDDDGDGIPDAIEGTKDSDNDGVLDANDKDSDNDGVPDNVESGLPSSTGKDSDLDGIDDAYDANSTGGVDANGDGVDDKFAPRDTDGDGIPNQLDTDSDNDGISDIAETGLAPLTGLDSDNDGIDNKFDVTNTGGTDANRNGIDDAFEKVTDTDGDGAPNYVDTDSDNDGIPDASEFGDFNGDGISDQLQAEALVVTGVKGSGSIDVWILILLFVGVFMRTKKFTILLSALLLLSAPTWAGCNLKEGLQLGKAECWYLGFGVGMSHVEPETNTSGWNVVDKRDNSVLIHAGFQLNSHWSTEVTYADLGRAFMSHNNPALGKGKISYDVFSVMGTYSLKPSNAELNLILKAGYGKLLTKEDDNIGEEKIHGNQFVFGIAGQWRISKRWHARLVVDSYDKDAGLLAVTLSRHF
jgi:Cadherin-like/Cadherin domain/Putative Ig domain